MCASLQPICAHCTFHPGKRHNFKAGCLLRTLSRLKATQRNATEVGGKERE